MSQELAIYVAVAVLGAGVCGLAWALGYQAGAAVKALDDPAARAVEFAEHPGAVA